MIQSDDVKYKNDIILMIEEMGFVEIIPFCYKKQTDKYQNRRIILSFEYDSLLIAFRSRNIKICFELHYKPLSAKSVFLQFLQEILNNSDAYEIFCLLCDYCLRLNIDEYIFFVHLKDYVYQSSPCPIIGSSFFVLNDSKAYLFRIIDKTTDLSEPFLNSLD